MRKRRNSVDRSRFWGCVAYPACRGTRRVKSGRSHQRKPKTVRSVDYFEFGVPVYRFITVGGETRAKPEPTLPFPDSKCWRCGEESEGTTVIEEVQFCPECARIYHQSLENR